MAMGIGQDGNGHRIARDGARARAQLLCQAQGFGHLVELFLRNPGLVGRLHIDREPFGLEFVGQAPGSADKTFAQRARADANQQAFAGRPGARDGARAHVGAHLVIHPFGSAPHGQLAQGGEIAFAEKFLDGALGLVGDIDFAILQTLDQLIRWQVDQFDVGDIVNYAVGDGLAHDHAGDLGNYIVQAFDVLDVYGAVHIDTGIQKFFHVGVALGMARTGHVGMRQLIHQDQLGLAFQDGIDIHLG